MSQVNVSRYQDRLQRIAALAGELSAADIVRESEDLGERLASGRLFVTCLGQFKRGKSTLLNALLGRTILPAGVVPVTSVVTIVRYGAETKAVVRYVDGRHDTIEASALNQFVSESHNPDNEKMVAAVEVFTPSDILAGGLCLVDTPGLGSVSVAGSNITRQFVPHVDAALVVLGIDPPITEDEIRLVEEVAKETQTLIFVLNKADKSPHDDVIEARTYTERLLSERLRRPEKVFQVSAIEVIELCHETRQWLLLQSALQELVAAGSEGATTYREQRVSLRLLQQLRREALDQRRALLDPIEQTEARLRALQSWMADADGALRELSHRLMGQQESLTPVFASMRDRFVREQSPTAFAALETRVSALPVDRHLHQAAMTAAHDIAETGVKNWLDEIEPVAARHYSEVTARFAQLINELLHRLAEAEPSLADLPPLQPDLSFRMNRGFYFAGLWRLTGKSLPSRIIVVGKEWRRHYVLRRASDYLHRLIDVNAHRVYEDLRQRVFESRRQLETELRGRLNHLSESATRALERAQKTRALGEEAVRNENERLSALLQQIGEEIEALRPASNYSRSPQINAMRRDTPHDNPSQ